MSDTDTSAAPPPAPESYDPTRMYAVELNCPAECPKGSGKMLYPGRGRRNLVRGDLVTTLGQAVTRAVPV